MAKVYVLKDAAQVNVVGGLSTLMMAGSVLPENVDKVQLQHLLDNGIAEEGEFVGGLEPVLTGDLSTQLTFRSDDEAAGKSAKSSRSSQPVDAAPPADPAPAS
jgi:hypothetical protein